MAVLSGHSAVITGAGDPEQLRGFDVGADFFSILGVKAIAGTAVFAPSDTAWQGTKAVLVNETLWRSRFGSDPGLVGSLITLDNERYRVAGIIPARSAWPTDVMLWYPFTYDPADLANSRGADYINTIARLKPGATLASASADMHTIASRLEQQYPKSNTDVGAMVVPMQEWITGKLRLPLLVLLGGVAFVLLIACANVANLLLVRGVAREGELAVRTALGAGRGRLVRQLVTESMVLSLIGGAAGFLLAIAGTSLLVSAAPKSIPRLDLHPCRRRRARVHAGDRCGDRRHLRAHACASDAAPRHLEDTSRGRARRRSAGRESSRAPRARGGRGGAVGRAARWSGAAHPQLHAIDERRSRIPNRSLDLVRAEPSRGEIQDARAAVAVHGFRDGAHARDSRSAVGGRAASACL